MRKVRFALLVALFLAAVFLAEGRFLVVDATEHADVILVLAGDTQVRPQRGVELLQQGYAPKLILDVPAQERVFQWPLGELAQRWIETLPTGKEMSLCSISGLSTKAESHEAEQCIERAGAHNVLLVTSDFHTRRALSTFRHEAPGLRFSIAAAHNPTQFGGAWWRQREWAKTSFYEWMRLLWWQAVDRWR